MDKKELVKFLNQKRYNGLIYRLPFTYAFVIITERQKTYDAIIDAMTKLGYIANNATWIEQQKTGRYWMHGQHITNTLHEAVVCCPSYLDYLVGINAHNSHLWQNMTSYGLGTLD